MQTLSERNPTPAPPDHRRWRTPSTLIAITALASTLILAGCALSPLAKRTASFSTAAAATVQDASNAYQVVEQAHQQMDIDKLVVTFDPTKPNQLVLKSFLTDQDLQAHTDALNGIQQYAELLAEVSGDQPLTALDAPATALATSIKNISANDFTKAGISSDEIDAGVAGLHFLGQLLIEHDRSKKLPKILNDMDPHLQSICALLKAEIGTPKTRGLRNELLTSYDGQIQYHLTYIKLNAASLTPAEKRSEIEALPKLVEASKQADQTLAATAEALDQLAKTHHALATSANKKESVSFKVHLAELIRDGQNISAFYNTLESQ